MAPSATQLPAVPLPRLHELRVLVLTQRLPYAPNRGDRLRAFHEIRQLRKHGWAVDVLALVHDAEEAEHADAMRADGMRIETAAIPKVRNTVTGFLSLVGRRPLTLALLNSPCLPRAINRLTANALPDVVMACSSSMAAVALRAPLNAIPLVVDFVDVDSEKWRALGQTSRWPMSWVYRREHRTLQAFEALAARRACRTVLTTERERQALLAFAPDARVDVLANGIDVDSFARPPSSHCDPRVVFTGVMNYGPNADAAVLLARSIWPLVRARHPQALLDIVGASPGPDVRALHDPSVGVTVTGSVPDVRPYLWRAKVAVAPLRVARGVQNKVLEAAAAGLPCVVSPAVRAGLPTQLQDICPVAETPGDFATAITDCLVAHPQHQYWSSAVAGLDWGRALDRLPAILSEAAGHRA